MGFFEPKTETKVLQTPQEAAARTWLANTLQQGTPTIATAGVAGLAPQEQQASQMTSEYAGTPAEGLDYLRSTLGGSSNVMEIPEYRALLDQVFKQGSLEANRLGRSLQIRGGTSASTGRDMLGRLLGDVQSQALATMAPYAQGLRNEKLTAAEALNRLGEQSILNRLNALSTSGGVERQLDQLRKDAAYNQQMMTTMFPYQQQAGLAQTILQNPAQWTVTQKPSTAQIIGQTVGGAVEGAGKGSAGGPWGAIGGGIAGGFQGYAQAKSNQNISVVR